MKTAGRILKEARLEKDYSLEQVEQATKIRMRFLEAIESDNYTPLPSLSYAKGFVKNYADFLGLDSRTVLAFFRRQSQDTPKHALLPKEANEHFTPSAFRFTPRRFFMLLTGLLVILFLSYFGFQYRTLQQAPLLDIESPQNEMITTEPRMNVVGRTDPDATVTINNVSVLVRSDGKFFDSVQLHVGVNRISVSAVSRFGKTTTMVRDVSYQTQDQNSR